MPDKTRFRTTTWAVFISAIAVAGVHGLAAMGLVYRIM
jgi:hypothetical protein